MPEPIVRSAIGLDLSKRIVYSATVVASPAAAAETVVATSPALDASLSFATGCFVMAWLAYTIGTTGASARVRIRQGTTTAGTIVADTGALTGGRNAAGLVVSDDVNGTDAAPAAGQQYALTLTIGAATAASAVSSVWLAVLAI